MQGHKEWLAEVQFLGIVDHPNLVKLLGYCSAEAERGIQRLLVYEYMANRSLEDHLFYRTSAVLPWKKRLEIILGAAQGLAYLHEGLEIQVQFLSNWDIQSLYIRVLFVPQMCMHWLHPSWVHVLSFLLLRNSMLFGVLNCFFFCVHLEGYI